MGTQDDSIRADLGALGVEENIRHAVPAEPVMPGGDDPDMELFCVLEGCPVVALLYHGLDVQHMVLDVVPDGLNLSLVRLHLLVVAGLHFELLMEHLGSVVMRVALLRLIDEEEEKEKTSTLI